MEVCGFLTYSISTKLHTSRSDGLLATHNKSNVKYSPEVKSCLLFMTTLKVLTWLSLCLRYAKNLVTNYVFVSSSSTNYQLYLIKEPTQFTYLIK